MDPPRVLSWTCWEAHSAQHTPTKIFKPRQKEINPPPNFQVSWGLLEGAVSDIRYEQLFTVNDLWKCQSTLEGGKAISKHLCDKMLFVGQRNGCQKILISMQSTARKKISRSRMQLLKHSKHLQ